MLVDGLKCVNVYCIVLRPSDDGASNYTIVMTIAIVCSNRLQQGRQAWIRA